jgi:hypothetical protein
VRARAQSKTVHATKSSSFAFEVVSWVYDVKAVVQHVVFDLTCADLFGRERKKTHTDWATFLQMADWIRLKDVLFHFNEGGSFFSH